jgi:hypothetical protein
MTIKHPRGGKEIFGRQLAPGEELQPGDVYDCSDGTWRNIGNMTRVPEESTAVFVRPGIDDLMEEAAKHIEEAEADYNLGIAIPGLDLIRKG